MHFFVLEAHPQCAKSALASKIPLFFPHTSNIVRYTLHTLVISLYTLHKLVNITLYFAHTSKYRAILRTR